MKRAAARSAALAAVALAMPLSVGIVRAADIAEPEHGVSFTYREALWKAAPDDKNLAFTCLGDACGGTGTECGTNMLPTRAGMTAAEFAGVFYRDFAKSVVNEMSKSFDAKIVDEPTGFMVGDRPATLSSVRYGDGTETTRMWIYGTEAPFGVAVLYCTVPEAAFDKALPSFMALASGIKVPKN